MNGSNLTYQIGGKSLHWMTLGQINLFHTQGSTRFNVGLIWKLFEYFDADGRIDYKLNILKIKKKTRQTAEKTEFVPNDVLKLYRIQLKVKKKIWIAYKFEEFYRNLLLYLFKTTWNLNVFVLNK